MTEDEKCKKTEDGVHEPDLNTATVEVDGDETYVDVLCKHCGTSGCIGKLSNLTDDIDW